MIHDGKVYRNLQEQVGYLTGKYNNLQDQIDDVRSHLTKYILVETLPTGDDIDTSAIYLLGPMGEEPNTYYEEWVYVQTDDETWVWEKLGDTDSVDLSGYLQIQDGVTTLPQVYGKTEDGDQAMVNMDIAATALTISFRDANGRTKVAAPDADGDAANKKYVVDNFVAKMTGTPSYPKAYVLLPNGDQGSIEVNANATADTIVRRTGDSQINVPYTPVAATNATSKGYVDGNFLAKDTTTSTYNKVYTKWADGSQAMVEMSDTARYNAIVRRTNQAQIALPNQVDYVPTADQAVSKRYVDAVVGQLLYLHDLEIIITVDASNKLYVKAYLVNGSSTAITSLDRHRYRRIDVQWGAFGPDIPNAEAVAVTKLPDGFRQDEFDEPVIGFLYQYISGGNLVSGKANSNMSSTITDTVITW